MRFGVLSQRLAGSHKNLRYELRSASQYSDLSDHTDKSIDAALFLGNVRSESLASTLRTIKAGGFVYLTNADRVIAASSEEWQAERLLYKAVRERGGMIRYLVDFVPALVAPSQGMLVRLN